MQITICKDYPMLCRIAAQEVALVLKNSPNPVLGLPTGSTPIGVYSELVRLHDKEGLSFAMATTFNLDEYIGIAAEHPGSYRYFMNRLLFSMVDIDPTNTHIPDGMAISAVDEAEHYEAMIRQMGPIDLQLLGIGTNGHIGFNEPGTAFNTPCRVAELSQETRVANAAHFGDDLSKVPTHAITMGIATITTAKRIVLMASGSHKASIIRSLVKSDITPDLPATALRNHPDVLLLLDEEAASLI